MNLKIPNWLYDILKWLCILGLPALSAIWGWPNADEIPATIQSVTLFLGTVIGISSVGYKPKGDRENAGSSNS